MIKITFKKVIESVKERFLVSFKVSLIFLKTRQFPKSKFWSCTHNTVFTTENQ